MGVHEEEGVLIAICELLCLMLLAVAQGQDWEWTLVIFVTGNSDVESWLHKRTARNRWARFLLRLLQRFESTYHFHIYPAGINTSHNASMDYTSRAKRQLVKLDMERQGFAQIDFVSGWHEVLATIEQGAPLVYPGEAGDVAQCTPHSARPQGSGFNPQAT